MCQSPDVRVMDAPVDAVACEIDGAQDVEGGESITAKLRSQGLMTIGTEASLNLCARRRPIFDVDRETLLREEEESEVQLFLFPNPTPGSPPPPPISGTVGDAATSTRTSSQGSSGWGFSTKISPSSDSTPGRKKSPSSLALGFLQQDVAGVLNPRPPTASGKGSGGGEGQEGGGLGVDDDLDLQALESKLELITLQRNVSAVKCEIFLDILEAHRRKGRQLPGIPVPPSAPPAHPLPRPSSRALRTERGSSDPAATGAHSLNPDASSRKVRSSKTSARQPTRLHRAYSLHKSGLADAKSPASLLHSAECLESYHRNPQGLIGLGPQQKPASSRQSSRRCSPPERPVSQSARHAPRPVFELGSLSPPPQYPMEPPPSHYPLAHSSSLEGAYPPTASGLSQPIPSAHTIANPSPHATTATSTGGSGVPGLVAGTRAGIGSMGSPLQSVAPPAGPAQSQRKRRTKPPNSAPTLPAPLQYSEAYPPVTVPALPRQYSDNGAHSPVTASAAQPQYSGTGAYPPVSMSTAALPLTASPVRAKERMRGDMLGPGDVPAVVGVPAVSGVPAVQYRGAIGAGGVGPQEGGLTVYPPQASGGAVNPSQGSSGISATPELFRAQQGARAGLAGASVPSIPMFTGRFSQAQVMPMLLMEDGELDPCPSPDDGPRVAPGFENLPKLPPPTFPVPPTPNMESQGSTQPGHKPGPSFSLLHALPSLPVPSVPVPDLGGSLADWSQKALPHLAHAAGDAGSGTFPAPQFECEQVVPPLPKPLLCAAGGSSGKARSGHAHRGAVPHSRSHLGADMASAAGAPLGVPTMVPAGGATVTGWAGASLGTGGSSWAFAGNTARLHVPAV